MSGLLESLTPEEEATLRAPEPPVEEQPKEPEAPVETEEQKAERLRDQTGKFAKEEDIAKQVVPLARHLEERKTLQARIKDLEAAQQRERETLAQRLQRLESLAKEKEPEAPKAPSWDDAPLEAGKHVTQDVQGLKAEIQQANFASKVIGAFQWDKAEFAKDNADYTEAENFLVASRTQELALYNPGVPQWQLRQMIEQEALQLAATHLQNNSSPAKAIYDLARARGYQKKAAEPAKPDPAAAIEAAAKAATASKSLGTVGGSAAEGRVSLESLAKMDESEFDKLTSDPKAWRKLMGGA